MIEEKMQKEFYRPVCNETEIERIFNVKNSDDYLLRLRADTIVDHMRLFRVYRNKALVNGKKWSLESSFSTEHYKKFLSALGEDARKKCEPITAGNIFSTEPNGEIFSTEYGPIITLCDSLTFFSKFMNLGLMDFGDSVPPYIHINSIRIALRVMLQTEALDFYMDPRGIIPLDIAKTIHFNIPHQLQFIAGHEYAHFLLGHLDENNLVRKPFLRAIFSDQKNYGDEKTYNYSQKNEFEADTNSITLCKYNNEEKINILEGALLWFASLEILEGISDTLSPPTGFQTHPTAMDRFENLLHTIKMPAGYDYSKPENLKKSVSYLKEFFIKDIQINTEFYEKYGSAYLDEPNTEWRGKELIDRVDYY